MPDLTIRSKLASDRTWSTGLFDCCSDWHSCCLTCWCPCVAFGRTSEILDKGSSYCCVNGTLYTLLCIFTATSLIGPFYSCCYRTKLREQYLSGENHCNDFWIHWFCHGCALCQEYCELQNRGFDVSAGWRGNPHIHNKAVSMAPVVEARRDEALVCWKICFVYCVLHG